MMVAVPDDFTINSFDEFFENELYQLQNSGSSDESLDLSEQYVGSPERTSAPSHSQSKYPEIPTDLSEGAWQMPRDGNTNVKQSYFLQNSTPVVSPLELHNREFCFQPDTSDNNPASATNNFARYRNGTSHQMNRVALQLDREKTLSPTPMYAYMSANDDQCHNSWQQDFQDFNLEHDGFGTPLNLKSADVDFNFGSSNVLNTGYTASPRAPRARTRYHYPFQNFVNAESFQEPPKNFAEPSPQFRQGDGSYHLKSWDMEASRSLDGSQYSAWTQESQRLSANSQNAYSRPNLRSWKSTGNFRPDNPNNNIVPIPQQPVRKTTSPPYSTFQPGLGIHYPPPEEIGCAIPYMPMLADTNQSAPIVQSKRNLTLNTYPVLPPTLADTRSRHQRHKSLSCSPSQHSPGYSYREEHTSPARTGRSRRKSIHKPGPIKDTPTLSNQASPTHGPSRNRSQSRSRSTHTRTRSASSKPRPKHASQPVSTAAAFDFDFVNYTAQDSAKLMADVAPSGSSRTRARREQEAREKRKKLNEAAINAVRSAGGDVRDLQQRLAS